MFLFRPRDEYFNSGRGSPKVIALKIFWVNFDEKIIRVCIYRELYESEVWMKNKLRIHYRFDIKSISKSMLSNWFQRNEKTVKYIIRQLHCIYKELLGAMKVRQSWTGMVCACSRCCRWSTGEMLQVLSNRRWDGYHTDHRNRY